MLRVHVAMCYDMWTMRHLEKLSGGGEVVCEQHFERRLAGRQLRRLPTKDDIGPGEGVDHVLAAKRRVDDHVFESSCGACAASHIKKESGEECVHLHLVQAYLGHMGQGARCSVGAEL
jgi:hypothetical protein